jgi:hypothetical protein
MWCLCNGQASTSVAFRQCSLIAPFIVRMIRFAFFIAALLAGTAGAETLERAERPCLAELLRGAQAACLGYLADERDAAMEARIASTLSGLQAAYPGELRVLTIRYREAQAAWRVAVEEGCEDDDIVFEQRCRLAAVLARAKDVAESLARASADLGGRPEAEIPVPEAVEIVIPLELPPGVGTGDETVSVPLWVPVLP